MSSEFIVLLGTAATIGLVHTIVGPDHYLPFIMLSRARKWSSMKTAVITFLCGVGHVVSSVVLGFLGIAIGVAVFKLESIEAMRGEIAAWLLIIFGFTYFIWGIRRAIQNQPHKHLHFDKSDEGYIHSHESKGQHRHSHDAGKHSLTPWVLFTIFVFGPCEPLIPLIMYPAAKGSMTDVAMVASVFGLVTIGTMISVVMIAYFGMSNLQFNRFERYSHAFAGLIIFLCGGAIKFLGL